MDRRIARNLSSELGVWGSLLVWRWGSFFRIIENEKSLSPLFHNHNSSFDSWLNVLLTLSNLLFLCFCQQGLQISSNKGPPSRLCRHWLTLVSQTPACTTPGPSPTPPTPPALALAASACQPLLDTTPTCRPPTQTTKPRTSSPTPTCITAQALDPISSPWWRRGTPGASAPPPACCPARGPRVPEGPTAWWTRAWTPRARAWRLTAATATPPLPWAPRGAWMSPSGGLTDWQRVRQSERSEGGKAKRMMNKKRWTLKEKKQTKKREMLHVCLLFLRHSL